METIKSFFAYLFDPTPGSGFLYSWPMIILGLGLIIGASVFSHYYKKKKKEDIAFKKTFQKLSSTMAIFGTLILIATAIRYENIPYFAMRIWFAILLLAFLYTGYVYIKKWRKDYPELQKELSTEKSRPKKKTRSYSTSKRKR